MSKLAWAGVSGILGLVIGGLLAGGIGTVRGSMGGAVAGASAGVCEAGTIATEQNITDAATADRLVAATFASLAKNAPMLADPNLNSLQGCRTSPVRKLLGRAPA